MGSVVSFPVLCIVNAALCLCAYEIQRGQRVKLSSLPLCINGDDALLRGPPAIKETWEKMAKYVGMLPSVGKVYYSDTYLNINSTSYWYHPDGYDFYETERKDGTITNRVCYLETVPYINLGLLYGMTRSGGKAGDSAVGDEYSDLGVRAHALLNSCPAELKLTVYKAYLSRNRRSLSATRVPWFTPSHLGGLGLPIFDKFKPSDLDLRVMRKIYDHPDLYQVPSKSSATTWLTYKIAQKSLKRFPMALMSARSMLGVGGESLQSLVSLLCIESLFTTPAQYLNPTAHLSATLRFCRPSECDDAMELLAKDRSLGKLIKTIPDFAKREDGSVIQRGLADKIALALKMSSVTHLNQLRDLNSRVIKDKTIPLPEPFRLDALPNRALSIQSLTGTHTLASKLPFGHSSNFQNI